MKLRHIWFVNFFYFLLQMEFNNRQFFRDVITEVSSKRGVSCLQSAQWNELEKLVKFCRTSENEFNSVKNQEEMRLRAENLVHAPQMSCFINNIIDIAMRYGENPLSDKWFVIEELLFYRFHVFTDEVEEIVFELIEQLIPKKSRDTDDDFLWLKTNFAELVEIMRKQRIKPEKVNEVKDDYPIFKKIK